MRNDPAKIRNRDFRIHDFAIRDETCHTGQVQRVICGHVHCVVTGDLAGRVTITAPSTYVELDPDFDAEELEVRAGQPGFLVHRLAGDRIVTYSETVH